MNTMITAPDTPMATATTGEHWYGSMNAAVTAFLSRLRRIPAAAWLECAECDPHGTKSADAAVAVPLTAEPGVPALHYFRESQADEAVRVRLREVLDTMPAVVRRIRNRIDLELSVFDGIAHPAAVARMRRTARLAAFAIAARPMLSPDEFERLYRPFRSLIPTSDIALG